MLVGASPSRKIFRRLLLDDLLAGASPSQEISHCVRNDSNREKKISPRLLLNDKG